MATVEWTIILTHAIMLCSRLGFLSTCILLSTICISFHLTATNATQKVNKCETCNTLVDRITEVNPKRSPSIRTPLECEYEPFRIWAKLRLATLEVETQVPGLSSKFIWSQLLGMKHFKDWEYRKLGNYLTSETRFEEILENVCETSEVCFYFFYWL